MKTNTVIMASMIVVMLALSSGCVCYDHSDDPVYVTPPKIAKTVETPMHGVSIYELVKITQDQIRNKDCLTVSHRENIYDDVSYWKISSYADNPAYHNMETTEHKVVRSYVIYYDTKRRAYNEYMERYDWDSRYENDGHWCYNLTGYDMAYFVFDFPNNDRYDAKGEHNVAYTILDGHYIGVVCIEGYDDYDEFEDVANYYTKELDDIMSKI